jgi:hypothetical protein
MGERPADVRIDDLTNPEFPPEIAEAFDAMAPMAEAIEFTPDAVLEAAAAEAGLEDYGDDLYQEPLAVLTSALRSEARLSTIGVVSTFENLKTAAKNRLLTVDLLKRFPEIHDIEIDRPIIIAGQARTGTTHLHNLLSSDPALRSLPYWESVEPVPPLAEQGSGGRPLGNPDGRYERTAASLEGLNYALPYFRRMHDMYPEHVHEEIQLANNAFSSMLFETMAVLPTWRDHYLATDQTPYYDFIKTSLKVVTYLRRGEGQRWILKSPAHVEQFGPIMAVFPDATVVRTHRDPVSLAKSMSTMLAYSGRMSQQPDSLRDVGRYWIDRGEMMLRAAVDQRDVVPADQVLDVRFHEFMADDIATVETIYAQADLPFTEEVRGHMNQFMADHPRGKHGRVLYDLGDFGYDHNERREALQFYADAFDLELES